MEFPIKIDWFSRANGAAQAFAKGDRMCRAGEPEGEAGALLCLGKFLRPIDLTFGLMFFGCSLLPVHDSFGAALIMTAN
jgi:hypothetical protein